MAFSTQAVIGFPEALARMFLGLFLQCGSYFGVILDGFAIEIALRNIQNPTRPADAVLLPRFLRQMLFFFGRASELFCDDLLCKFMIPCEFGVHLLQAMILCFEIVQTLELFAIHAAVFLSPIVECRLTDSMISTNFSSRFAAVEFLQNRYNLLRCESTLLHLS